MAMAQEGGAVKVVHRIEQGFADIVAIAGFKVDAGFQHPASFAAGLLAFLGGEGPQVLLEVGKTLVGPVELAVATQQPAGVFKCLAVGPVEKQRVGRGQLIRGGEVGDGPDQLAANRRTVQVGSHQQPRAGGRREGNAHGQLRVVVAAEMRIGLGPGEIEDKLAVGMGLDEGRSCRGEALVILQGHVGGRPAAAGTYATGVLQGRQELVPQEGHVGACQRIPGLPIQLIDTGVLAADQP